MSVEAEYPEHDRLMKVNDESAAIGAFLDYGLVRQGLVLARWIDDDDRLYVASDSIQTILARYYDIDTDLIEAEKREMLDVIRKGLPS